MTEFTRSIAFPGASFLPAALAATIIIASSPDGSAKPLPEAETRRAAEIFSETGVSGGVMEWEGEVGAKSEPTTGDLGELASR